MAVNHWRETTPSRRYSQQDLLQMQRQAEMRVEQRMRQEKALASSMVEEFAPPSGGQDRLVPAPPPPSRQEMLAGPELQRRPGDRAAIRAEAPTVREGAPPLPQLDSSQWLVLGILVLLASDQADVTLLMALAYILL